jgi:hypothetical protein
MQGAVALETPTQVEARPRLSAAARRLVILAGSGALVAALTWRATTGLGWLVAMTVLVAMVIGGLARGRPGATGWVMAAATLWLAGAVCWRASDWVLATALPASCVGLAALALVCARRLEGSRLGEVGRAAIDALITVPQGAVDAAQWPAQALGGRARAHAGDALRGLVIGVPMALVFAALLAADPAFREAVSSLANHSETFASSGAWALFVIAELTLAASVLLRLRSASSEEAKAAAVSPPHPVPYRAIGAPRRSILGIFERKRLTPVAWGVALSQVVVGFAICAVANARSLFAGHAFWRAHGTPTYASGVHEGFVQVSIATLLAVACVVLGHSALRSRASERTPGGRGLIAIELTLLGLAGLALASSTHRLSLYEEAYGYTTARLGVRCFQVAIAGLLAMTALSCIARAWRGWGSAVAWSGLLGAVALGSLDADRWVAERNFERARSTGRIDIQYLASLSEDALPALAGAKDLLPAFRVVPLLDATWRQSLAERHTSDWRSWRGLGVRRAAR